MVHKTLIASFSLSLLLAACSGEDTDTAATTTPAAPPPEPLDPAAVVQEAVDAMGMGFLTSIVYTGEAWRVRNGFMQTPSADPPWPSRDTITNYRRAIDLRDLSRPSSRATGETFASNIFLDPPQPGTYQQNVAPDQKAWNQQLEIWLTPWGFLKGAQQYGATVEQREVDGDEVLTLTWQSPPDQLSPSGMRYTVTGYLDDDKRVSKVETWVDDPFMGDFHIVGVYEDYREINGLQVPTTMEQQRGGGGIFGVKVDNAIMNPVDIRDLVAIPAPPTPPGAGAPPAPPGELAERLAENVYLIKGGYQSLALGFADHVVVFEAGQSEARGQQILDEVKRLFPDKPIRYLINSHPHSDHTAGMVPFVREGATIVTHENNVNFLRMALSTPRTLLGQPPLNPQFMSVGSVTTLEDETMKIELHHIAGNEHSDGIIVGLVPSARVLFQADFTLPQPGAQPNPFVRGLAAYVRDNDLDFEHYIAVHAAAVPQTKADLLAAIE